MPLSVGRSLFYAIVGEPGLMPDQAADLGKLREAIISADGSLGISRGYHAVGCEIRGVKQIRMEQGRDHALAPLPVGSASVTAHAALAGRGPDGEPGWRDLTARILGVKLDEVGGLGTYPVPLMSDASALTVAVKLHSGEIWPRWAGTIQRIDRVQDVDGHDVVIFHAQAHNFWLRDGGLNPLYLDEDQRVLREQPASTRMHTVLDSIGFLKSDVSPVYRHRAQSDLGAWDRFGPSRLRQGFGDADRVIVPEITAAGQNVQRLLEDTALAAEGSIVMHQGIGPIRATGPATGPARQRLRPDKTPVRGDAILPDSSYQIDWGGVLAFQKWGIDENDLYTTGAFETPIKLTGADSDDDWTGVWRGRPAKNDAEYTKNTAIWSMHGDPVPTTFILDTAAGRAEGSAQETRRSHRKYGLNQDVRSNLPFMARTRMKAVAQRFLGTWIAPRPSFDLATVIPPDDTTGDHHRVAAALSAGHGFGYETDDAEYPMHCTRTIEVVKPGQWQKVVTCLASRVIPGQIGLEPELPAAYSLDRTVVTDTGGPVPAPTSPTAEPERRGFDRSDPLTAAPLEYPRHGPRIVFAGGGQPVVFWTWQTHLNDLPLRGWRIEAKLIPDQGAAPDIPDVVIAHPWKTWHRFVNPAAGTGGRWPLGRWEMRVYALSRVSGGVWKGDNVSSTVVASSSEIDPPGVPRDFTAIRQPDSWAVMLAWRPPEDQGGAEITHYAVYRDNDFSAPVAGHDRIDPSKPTRVLAERVWPPRQAGAVTYHVVAFNGSPSGDLAARAATAGVDEVSNVDGFGPIAETVEPIAPAFGVYRTATGVTVLWDELRPGNKAVESGATGDITNWFLRYMWIEFTQGTRTWSRRMTPTDGADRVRDPVQGTWWRTGYLGGAREEPYDDDFTEDAAVSVRLRVQGGIAGETQFSDWTDPVALPAPEPPTVPRELAAWRQSETRGASDGWAAVWEAPASPGDRPSSRVDASGTPGLADRVFTDSDAAGRYLIAPDPGTDAAKGWGNRSLISAATERRTVEIDASAKAGTVEGPAAELALGQVRGMGWPEQLIVGRHSPASGRVRWVASMPRIAGDGQPSRFRDRVAGGTWREVDLHTTNPAARGPIPELTVGTGAATIEVGFATETGEWSPTATAGVPAAAVPGRHSDNRPRNVRTGWWDGSPLWSTIPSQTDPGQFGPAKAVVDDDAVTLVIMWDEPYLTTNGLRASSYLITVKVAYGSGHYLFNGTEGVYCHFETGTNLLHAAVPISDSYFFHGSPYWEHPQVPGLWGPFFRLAIQAQYRTGVNANGFATRPLSANSAYLGYHRMPRRPPARL